MNLPASVEGRERARLFCALCLRTETLDALCAWEDAHVRDGRAVPREHLHVTLAFLGHRPVEEIESILDAMRAAAADAAPIRLRPERYRETRSVGMLVLTDEDAAASRLAEDLHGRLEELDVYEREQRPWLPHLTVVRFRERLRLRPPVPELGRFAPSDAAAYLSVLRPSGAEYVVLEPAVLGGN